MTVRYTKLADKKTWAVIGPADEVRRGIVSVTSRNGRKKQLSVFATSGVFRGKYNDLAGIMCRFGYLTMLHDDDYDEE